MLPIVFALLPLAVCQTLVGGPVAVDVNRDDIKQVATFALGEINTLLGSKKTLVEVVSAKTQDVSGTNYMMVLQLQEGGASKTCHVTVFYQALTNTKMVSHQTCGSRRRDSMMTGGLTTADVNSTEIQQLANFALRQINEHLGTPNTLTEVISAKTQVVQGILYILKLRLNKDSESLICNVDIWCRPFLRKQPLIKHSCSNVVKRAGELLGGPSDVDVTTLEVTKMASFAVSELNGIQGAQNSLVKVISAQQQEVPGMIYLLKLSLKNGEKRQTCTISVLYQVGFKPQYQLVSDSCGQLS